MDAATVDRLVQAAQNCGMYGPRRDRLLAGLDPALRARLDLYRRPADQLRSDLETLAGEPPDAQGTPPLAVWLANARYMADRGRGREAAAFAEQWVAAYMRWGLTPPRWSDDLAPARAVPEALSRSLFGRAVPVGLVVAGVVGVVGIALADPAGAQGAKAADFGYLACLSAVGLGVSVGLREFLGPNRVLLLIIAIFALLTLGYTVASAVTWPAAEPTPVEPPGAPEPERQRPVAGAEAAHAEVSERDAFVDGMGDELDDTDARPDEPVGSRPAPGARAHATARDAGRWLSTAEARRRAPEGFETVPPGDFWMGSPDGEAGRFDIEGPQHPVTFTRPLWVQAHEVTQAEWRALMGTSPSFFDGCDDCPVEQVSWFQAVAYANARSEVEGLPACYRLGGCTSDLGGCGTVAFAGLDCAGYRLPTEAEWEYFARAGGTGRYATGDSEDHLDALGWYGGNSGGRTQPVGGKAPNGFGLYDVHGNVWEWCHDWYGRYDGAPATDPPGPPSGSGRVFRGGAFLSTAHGARAAFRDGWGPGGRDRGVGFRHVRAPRAPRP